jgi:hypothetical protein
MDYATNYHTFNTLSRLTSQGRCYITLLPPHGVVRVAFPPEHPQAKRGYAHVCGRVATYARDENGVEMPWAKHLRESGPQPSSKPCHNHEKVGCTADTCF